jgi:hypothetical protein
MGAAITRKTSAAFSKTSWDSVRAGSSGLKDVDRAMGSGDEAEAEAIGQ